MTWGSSSATNWKTPPLAKVLISDPEPEYAGLHHIDMEVEDQNNGGYVSTTGLLDSGSQGSCINKAFSHSTLANHKLKADPITVVMADGNHSSASPVTHFDTVAVRIAGHEEQLALDTMSLSHPIILGMPWHKEHNPRIDYQKNTLTFDSESCRQRCSHYGKTVPLRSRHRKPRKPLTQKPLTPQITDTETTDQGSNMTESPRPTPRTAPKVALIGATVFAFICNQLGTELYFMSYR